MKKSWLLPGGIAVLIVAAVLMVNSSRSEQPHSHPSDHSATAPAHHASEDSAAATEVIPAHFETPPNRASLGPTLPPEQFTGPTRDAYRAAREIPVTLAQLRRTVAVPKFVTPEIPTAGPTSLTGASRRLFVN